jgi:hypothetical protein
MKHSREDYNSRIQDSAGIIGIDEPVFLLRAQDENAHAAVRAWAYLHRASGGQDAAYHAAMRHADLMEARPKKKLANV